jgi:hypothetical protein
MIFGLFFWEMLGVPTFFSRKPSRMTWLAHFCLKKMAFSLMSLSLISLKEIKTNCSNIKKFLHMGSTVLVFLLKKISSHFSLVFLLRVNRPHFSPRSTVVLHRLLGFRGERVYRRLLRL